MHTNLEQQALEYIIVRLSGVSAANRYQSLLWGLGSHCDAVQLNPQGKRAGWNAIRWVSEF